jgi:RNA polymerase sigma-B factor
MSADPTDPASMEESRHEATARLFARRDQVSGRDRKRVEDELVRLNMRVAAATVLRFQRRGIPADDIQQVAYVGLVKAVRRFDPRRGSDFLSYAVPTIRGEVRRYFRDQGWVVRPPRSLQEAQLRIRACRAELCQELGRAPRPSEIAEHTGIELETIVEALGAAGCFRPASLDAPTGVESETVGDRLGSLDDGFDLAEIRAVLEPLLRRLSERERLILDRRFVANRTQAEIGRELGVTQMQVSRLLTALLLRLRKELEGVSAA